MKTITFEDYSVLPTEELENFTGIVLYDKTWNTERKYLNNGKTHRLDGPAVIYHNGDCYWVVDGLFVHVACQEEFESWLKVRAFE